jgi:cardiolipin synthase
MTGFRGFRPSWLGKLNTTVQIMGITAIMFAASVPYYTGYYLPTVYAAVFALSVFSGLHYVFFVSKLMNEDRKPTSPNETASETPATEANSALPNPPHQS